MDRDFDFDELRVKLGIPTRAAISGKDQDVLELSMIQLTRVNSEELEDEQLYVAFQRSVLKNQNALIFKICREPFR